VQVLAQRRNDLGRIVVVVVVAAIQPPASGGFVVGRDVELVDDERRVRREQSGKALARLRQRLDMVQRHDSDRRGERPVRLVELVQGDRADVGTIRGGVDRHDVVARGGQGGRQLAVARADLEHAGGRPRQRGAHERVDVGGQHRCIVLNLSRVVGYCLRRTGYPSGDHRCPRPS
jgi:hypothetical protein